VLKFKIVRLFENIVAENVSKIVVISAPMKADLVNRGFSSSKISINRNFVFVNNDMDYESKKIRRFAYVGNISNIEGIDILIEAFEALKLEGAELMIYGNGSELGSLISKYGKEYFYGGFDKSEVESIYEKIDAVVINRRGFEICQKVTPLKPLEAINYNKLLIASDVGGLEDVMKGNEANYISYESDSKTELMKALLEAYNMSTIEIKEKLVSSKTWLNEFRSERSYIKELRGLYEQF
jgi:glycosyltransferase involved in cell wall biosynthesis